jgi:hypothetical protein
MQNRPLAIIFLLFITINASLSGQKKVNSPYHRFNIGGISHPGSFRSLAMGGTSVAMRDNSSIYFYNPASYTSIDTTSFIFDFGFDGSAYGLTDGTTTDYSADGNFNHLLMGFPVHKRIGVGIGLIPISNGYYYLSEKVGPGHPDYDPEVGEVVNIHKGKGGLAEFFIGAGLKLSKNFSAGANMSVLLGQIERLNQFEFQDYSNTFNQRGNEVFRIAGINFDLGLQYTANLKKNHFLTIGGSYTPSKYYNSSQEILKERFSIYTYPPLSPDTLDYTYIKSKELTKLPATYRSGISFGKKDKYTIEFDYQFTNWDNASIMGDNSTIKSTSAYRLGFEFVPEKYSNTSFLKRIEYRIGLNYGDNYLILDGVQLKEYGASTGFAVRMRPTSSLSKLTWYFQYTRREGDLAKGLPNEDIFTTGISLNLYDFWFIKKRYD